MGKTYFYFIKCGYGKIFNFHPPIKCFFVNLAFNNINGMLLFSKLLNILGQISDSINIAKRGLKFLKIYLLSIYDQQGNIGELFFLI